MLDFCTVQVAARSVVACAPGAGRRSNPRDAPHPPPRRTMVKGDASPALQLAESVRQWSSQAVTAQLDALDGYLRHRSCFLGRTTRELLGVFASGECHARASACASRCRGERARLRCHPYRTSCTRRGSGSDFLFFCSQNHPLPPPQPRACQTLHLQKTIKRRHSMDCFDTQVPYSTVLVL